MVAEILVGVGGDGEVGVVAVISVGVLDGDSPVNEVVVIWTLSTGDVKPEEMVRVLRSGTSEVEFVPLMEDILNIDNLVRLRT